MVLDIAEYIYVSSEGSTHGQTECMPRPPCLQDIPLRSMTLSADVANSVDPDQLASEEAN